MRAWVRSAVAVCWVSALACSGAPSERPGDDAGSRDAAATGDDVVDANEAKDAMAASADVLSMPTALDAALGSALDASRPMDAGSESATDATLARDAGLDATVPPDAPDASTLIEASVASVEASAEASVLDADTGADGSRDAGGVIVVGDGGVLSNQATSYLVNPAHTNAVSDPSIAPPLALAWTRTFGSQTETYPLIAGGLVYLLVNIDSMNDAQLIALDETTGDTRWGPVDLGTAFVRTDAYDSGRILVTDPTDGIVRAFDAATGAPRWVSTVAAYSSQPPTAYGGLLYIGGTGTVTAVDENTGATVWTANVGGSFGTSPSVTEEAVFVASGVCSNTFALDRHTGSTIWQFSGSCAKNGGPAPAVFGGRVWIPQDTGGGEVVLDESTGTLLASYGALSLPTFVGTTAIWDQRPLTALDLSSGRNAWTFAGDGNLNGNPVVAGGTVYMGSGNGRIFGVDQTTGVQTWQEQVVSLNLPGPMTAGEGVLLTMFQGQVFAYRHVDVPDASVLDRAPDGGCPASGCLQPAVALAAEPAIGLAVDSNNVYWTAAGNVAGEIRAIPKTGGSPITLYSQANTEPWGIAVDVNNLYWAVPNFFFGSPTTAVMEMPVAGGSPTPLVSNLDIPQNIAVGPTHVYFSSANGPDAVLSVPIAGGAPTVIASAAGGGGALAVDGVNLYFSTDATYKIPFAGGTAMPIGPPAAALASDGTDLYYVATNSNGVGVLGRISLAGGSPTLLVDGRQGSLAGVAVDGDNVYWTEANGTIMQGAVAALPKSGGRVAILAAGLGDPTAVVVDDTGVYFITNGEVGKIPKLH